VSMLITRLQTAISAWFSAQPVGAEASKAPEQVRVCNRHQVAFTRYEKDGKVAYLHTESQGWCRDSESGADEAKVVAA
jgi:hypothetical protein